MKRLDRNNTILCFEMMPEQYKILRDNIELNQLNDVLAFNLALGDKVGYIQMPKVNYDQSVSNFGATMIESEQKPVQIAMVTLDSMLSWITKPVSFVKIDVEGHEVEVLKGGKELIRMYRPIIAIEIWNHKYHTFLNSSAWTEMKQNGYDIHHIQGDEAMLVGNL